MFRQLPKKNTGDERGHPQNMNGGIRAHGNTGKRAILSRSLVANDPERRE